MQAAVGVQRMLMENAREGSLGKGGLGFEECEGVCLCAVRGGAGAW